MAHPDFGRSVNPISTRGDKLCPPNYYWYTRICRPSDGPAIIWAQNKSRHILFYFMSESFFEWCGNVSYLKPKLKSSLCLTVLINILCLFLLKIFCLTMVKAFLMELCIWWFLKVFSTFEWFDLIFLGVEGEADHLFYLQFLHFLIYSGVFSYTVLSQKTMHYGLIFKICPKNHQVDLNF